MYVTTDNETVRKKLQTRYGIRHTFPPNTFSMRLPVYVEGQLRTRPDVEVERVRVRHIQVSPADQTPYGIETIYNDTSIEATAGGSGVDVAVLDTGTTKEHQDLVNRVEKCRDYTGGSVDDGSCDDGNGHGTHTSGTVLADAGSENTGIYGVAPEADLWAFKVCNDAGRCWGDDINAAIRDAAAEGAEVISISLGSSGTTDAEQDTLRYAYRQGTLVVSSAGNDGPGKDTMSYPAADTLVVGVAAANMTDRDGAVSPSNYRIADFSSRGASNDSSKITTEDSHLEVTAPGVDVLSTWNDGMYNRISGTSMAAPHISGLAAKIWSAVGDRDCDGKVNDDVRDELQTRALAFDLTRGQYAATGYELAAGLGLPMVTTPERVTPMAGTGVLDGNDDCRRQTHLHDDGDPGADGREAVVHLTSHDRSTADYALAVVDIGDVDLTDVAQLEFDYYEGPNNSDAAPDEVWLVIENESGRHIVYRTFNDGSMTQAEEWRTQDVTPALTDSDRPWVAVEISEPVTDPRRALDQLTADDLAEVGTNLTATYGANATVLAVGVGHGAPLAGPTVVDLYVDELIVNGQSFEFPLSEVTVEDTPIALDDGTDRVTVTIDLAGDWNGRTVADIDVRTLRLNGSAAIPGSATVGNFDGDSTDDELRVQFLKPQVDDDLRTGERVPVTVTGIFADNETSVAGTDHVTVTN